MSTEQRTKGAVHRRTIEFEAYDGGDSLSVTGRLRDERPWAEGSDRVEHVHDMDLALTIRKDDLTITAATATMARFPHNECPSITDAFGQLVGLNIGRGYTRAVQERFGGVKGCTHLEQLARTIGPVVIQAMTSIGARHRDWQHLDAAPSASPNALSALPHLGRGRYRRTEARCRLAPGRTRRLSGPAGGGVPRARRHDRGVRFSRDGAYPIGSGRRCGRIHLPPDECCRGSNDRATR